MAKIIGMNNGGGNTPPPQQPKIDLSKATEMKCQDCGGTCLLYTSPSPRDRQKSRMPSSA